MLSKLFKKKDDECELVKFLDSTKLLFGDVNKFKSKNVEMDLGDVAQLIHRTKDLVKFSKRVEDCLEDKKDDNKYKLQLLLIKDKFKQLDELDKLVSKYLGQLQEYTNVGGSKNVKKSK